METAFSFWAEDAEIYAPGRPPVRGMGEIRALVAMRRSVPGNFIVWEPLIADVSGSGDLGFTRGTYAMTFPGPGGDLVTTTGTYVSIWRRDEGSSWKCILEIHSPLPNGEPEAQD
jgi:ketosteroid isomerase-like protein